MAKRGRREVNRIDNSYGKYSPTVEARPVDTYIAPMQTGIRIDNKYADLAAGIKEFYTPAAAFLQAEMKEKAERDVATGQKMYTENGDRQSWEDYKANNPNIPLNKDVKHGYLLARTANEAQILRMNLQESYNRGEAVIERDGKQINIAETDDVESFNTWATGYTRNYIDQNMGSDVDPELFSNLFLPQAEKAVADLAAEHIKHRNAVYALKSESEHGELMRNAFMANVDSQGRFTATDYASKQALKEQYGQIIQSMIAQGIPREKVVKIALEQFMAIAESLDIDESEVLLEIALDVEVGDGVRLGALGHEGAKLKTAVFEIENRKEMRVAKEKRAREEERVKAVETITTKLFRENLKQHVLDTVSITDALYAAGATANEVAHVLGIMKQAYNAGRAPVDPDATARAIKQREQEQRLQFMLEHGLYPDTNMVLKAYGEGRLGLEDTTKYVAQNLETGGVVGQMLKDYGNDIEKQIKTTCGYGENMTAEEMTTIQYIAELTAAIIADKSEKEPERVKTPHGRRLLINDAVKDAYSSVAKSVYKGKIGNADTDSPDSRAIYNTMKKPDATYRKVTTYNAALNLQAALNRDPKGADNLKKSINAWASKGGDVSKHEAVVALMQQGFTLEQIEATLGISLTKGSVK